MMKSHSGGGHAMHTLTHLHSGCHQRHILEEANNPSEDQEDEAVNRPRRSITMGAIGDEKKGEKEAFPLPPSLSSLTTWRASPNVLTYVQQHQQQKFG